MGLYFVMLVYVLPASVLSMMAGWCASRVLRQRWDGKAAAVDATLASVVMFVAMFVLGVISAARNDDSFFGLLAVGLSISTVSVVVKHVICALRFGRLAHQRPLTITHE